MSDNERQEIGDRLLRLETSMAEKWSSHDKRSDERWADLMESVHEMKVQIKELPCGGHVENLIDLNNRLKGTEKWIDKAGWAIGVIYVAVIGALVEHWLKL